MTELLHQDGFLGTGANWAADVTLLLMLVGAAVFSYGFYLARQGRYDTHRWVQTGGAVFNLIMVGWMMLLPYRDFIVRDQGGPRTGIFYSVTIAHAVLGAAAIVFGWFVVLRGNKLMPIKALQFNNYKPFMRWAYGLYMGATVLGVLVYVTWFVLIDNPPLYK